MVLIMKHLNKHNMYLFSKGMLYGLVICSILLPFAYLLAMVMCELSTICTIPTTLF